MTTGAIASHELFIFCYGLGLMAAARPSTDLKRMEKCILTGCLDVLRLGEELLMNV